MNKKLKLTSSRRVDMRDINALLSTPISRIKTLRDDEGRGGFTLIELLVVVLIIGVLAAIAIPQYQKAVLKSKFSSLMPTTKAIRDGQEAYYLTNSRYADSIAKLDVTTANNDDMSISVSDDNDYAYTLATRPNINNNLIMYQKHSVNFPGEIHCEALDGNTQAEWLCGTALHAVKELGETATAGYKTYVIEGTGNGKIPFGCTNEDLINEKTTCTKISKNTKEICRHEQYQFVMSPNSTGYTGGCEYHTLNPDGTKTVKGYCWGEGASMHCTEVVYDENNQIRESNSCGRYASDGSCAFYTRLMKYNSNQKQTNVDSFNCQEYGNDNSCTKYRSTSYTEYEYPSAYSSYQWETTRTCSSFDEDNTTCTKWSTTVTQYQTSYPYRKISTQSCTYVVGADDNTAGKDGYCL